MEEPALTAAAWTVVGSVLVAIISGVFALLVAKQKRGLDAENEIMERELHFQSAALDFSDYMMEWNEITSAILELFRTSNIDRFLILRAWNGTAAPKWTTAFFQLRSEEHAKPYSYTHVQLDDDYVSKLRDTIARGHMIYKVDEIPESLIKSIYDSEGIKHSVWFHIDRKTLKDSESVALNYCSFATHSDEELTDEDILRCRMIASRIKGVSSSMNAHQANK